MRDTRGFAIGEVLLATLIWSGSFALIKLLLGEALGPAQWAAMAIVVLGITVVQVAARLASMMGRARVAALSWVR